MAEWYFESYSANGSFNAAAGRRLLEGTEMRQPETLARESLQNACDAERNPDEPVQVEYRVLSTEDHEAPAADEILALRDGEGPVARGLIEYPENPTFLFVEDFNTVGLGGAARADVPRTEADNFVRLCRNIGDTQQATDRGGTFGFGKAVYWSNSAIHLVAFYSRFEATERTGGTRSRFIAAGWFEDHEFEGRRYTGRAWLGRMQESDQGQVVMPLVDDEADAVASRLGFRPRPDEQSTGTSMLLVGAESADRGVLSDLRDAVEKHYWPRILDDKLTVSMYYGDEKVESPDLGSRVDLEPYLNAYRLANAPNLKTDQLPDQVHVEDLTYSPREEGTPDYDLGRVAVVMGSAGVPGQGGGSSLVEEPGVALMRSPRMVVCYYSTRGFPELPYGAVFIASEQVEDILRRSEPPAHDSWSASSTELDSVESRVVSNVLGKIRQSVTRFLDSFVEDRSQGATTCEQISREMGRYLKVGGGGSTTGASERYVGIQFASQPHRISSADGEVHRVGATVQVAVTSEQVRRYRKEHGSSPESLWVQVDLRPVLERGQHLRRLLPVDVLKESAGSGIRDGNSLLLPVDGPVSYRLQIVSEPLPTREMTVDMRVNAELESN